jgi:hypothetical protein
MGTHSPKFFDVSRSVHAPSVSRRGVGVSQFAHSAGEQVHVSVTVTGTGGAPHAEEARRIRKIVR